MYAEVLYLILKKFYSKKAIEKKVQNNIVLLNKIGKGDCTLLILSIYIPDLFIR